MKQSLALPLVSIVMVAGLLFPPVAPYTAVYAVLAALLIALFLLSSRNWNVYGTGFFRFVWLAILALLITLPFSLTEGEDLFVFAALIPVFLAPSVVMLMVEERRFALPQTVATLCLIGAIGAVGVAFNDVNILQIGRAGAGNNPIHFGGLSLLIGFMALVGLFGSRSAWRFIFLAGPVLGTTAALLSGSRGPVLAAIILAISTLPFLINWFWREKAFKAILVIGVALAIVGMMQIDSQRLGRAANVIGDITALFDANMTIDPASEERLVFYRAARAAFLQAPIFGHGSGHIGAATTPFIPEAFSHMHQPDHLHNDIADFAVLGGVFGILAYFCLIAAPLFAFRLTNDTEIRRATLLGGIILSVGYFTLGLTNAMFGILPQTTLFGLLLGILVGMAHTSSSETS